MPKSKTSSPTLNLVITDELYDRAKTADSGGCLIADAIKTQYPQYTSVMVDMATVRFSDRKAGVRYTYLTPEIAQHALLAFDQGWPTPTKEVTIRRAVQITTIIRSKPNYEKTEAARATRLAELETKVAADEELTTGEKRALTHLRKPYNPPKRPTSGGAATMSNNGDTVIGGRPRKVDTNPNLLRGRNRLFGAKTARPAEAFELAVAAAVEQRIADMNADMNAE